MMGKTRKMQSMPDHDATYHGLHKWYTSLFEKAGWMILAGSHGYAETIHNYKSSLDCLIGHLEKKHSGMRDKDKKEDLYIMLQNAKILLAHINKDF
jgi:hypothetical protein